MTNGPGAAPVSESAGQRSEAAAASSCSSPFASSDWWQQLETAPRSVLMLDYDGTLSPFVRERMQAKMFTGISERLLRLAVAPRTRLVLISGRPARELASLLPPQLKVEIWGSHGREHLSPDGEYAAFPLTPVQQLHLTQLEAEFRRNGFGFVLEKKVGSLAIHTRGLSDSLAGRITILAQDFSSPASASGLQAAGLEWLAFDGGVELRGIGCTKATAVERILSQESPRTPAAYLGDDQTDEDAFAALSARGPESPSLRVLVRPEPRSSAADLWLTPPDELLAFLDRWLQAVVDAEELS
ncbi:MAG: trehalose-phosphatase [Acidobacteriaceae bacterium]